MTPNPIRRSRTPPVAIQPRSRAIVESRLLLVCLLALEAAIAAGAIGWQGLVAVQAVPGSILCRPFHRASISIIVCGSPFAGHFRK